MPSLRSQCAHQLANRAVRPYNQSRRGDPCGRPPGLVPHFIQCVIARPVRKLAVAIRVPRPQAPLPKGGWHGEAVTGGFFPRTPGRARGPCPTKTLVGRDPCVPPHTALLAMCHCEAGAPVPTTNSVGADDPVAVPKIFALPYGGRLKF